MLKNIRKVNVEKIFQGLRLPLISNLPEKSESCKKCVSEGFSCVLYSSSQKRVVRRNHDTPIAEEITFSGESYICLVKEERVSIEKNAEDLVKIFNEENQNSQ